MANPLLKPTAPGHASIVAALWISDQIDVGGVPTKGAWDAKTGTFYPAHGAANLTPVALGSTGRNGLTSAAAACGIELGPSAGHTGTIWDIAGPEIGILVVGAKSSSTGTAVAVQNRDTFGSAEGWAAEFASTATFSGKANSVGSTNSAFSTTAAVADEAAAFLYRRQASTFVPTVFKNGSAASAASAGGNFSPIIYGSTERRAALFGFSASRQAAVPAVPCTMYMVVIWSDMSWCEATSSQPVGTAQPELAAIGTSGAQILAGSAYSAFFDFQDTPTTTGNAAPTVAENATAVGTYSCTQPGVVTLSGADAARFVAPSGASVGTFDLVFAAAPSFESPTDAGADNTYNVTLNWGGAAPFAVAVTVTNVAEPPGAPTGVSATAGNGQITVTGTPPAPNGGPSVTGYRAVSSPGGAASTFGPLPRTITGLTNGSTFTAVLEAQNSEGTGPQSAPSNSVTPQAVTYSASIPGGFVTDLTSGIKRIGQAWSGWVTPWSTAAPGALPTPSPINGILGAAGECAITGIPFQGAGWAQIAFGDGVTAQVYGVPITAA